MENAKYFIKNNYGKLALFVLGSMILTGALMLAENVKGLIG